MGEINIFAVLCILLIGTVVYLWGENSNLKANNLRNEEFNQMFVKAYSNCSNFMAGYENVVQTARECFKNENCTSITIVPNRNST